MNRIGSLVKQLALGRALAHRNYRLYIAGQSVSLIGTWMQQVAISWLVYRLTGSALLLGIVNFSSQIPAFFVAPLAGVLTDRWNRHRVLLVTQTLAMVQAVILLLLALGSHIAIWHIIVLSISLGLINAFDMPTRQTFLVDLVRRREDLPNAIALHSSIFNGARLIGPSVAGLLIAVGGESTCFLVNTLSYLPILLALAAMRDLPVIERRVHASIARGFTEGVSYVMRFSPILALLLLTAWVSFAVMPLMVLMPVFATDILHGGPATLGFLLAASGLGSLGSALYLASRTTVLGLGRLTAIATSGLGIAMICFSFSSHLALSLLFVLLSGFCMMLQMAASNTLLQTLVDEDKRGRVMSYFTMCFMGLAPLGSLLAGSIASRWDAPTAVRLGGVACVTGAAVFAVALPRLRTLMRPIYERAGILPAVAVAIQSSTDLETPPE